MFFRPLILIATLITSSSCSGPPIDRAAVSARTFDGRAQLHGLDSLDRIPDNYIVSFFPNYTHESHDQAIGKKASDFQSYRNLTFGYSATLTDEELHERVRWDPGVRWVEANQRVYLIEPIRERGYRAWMQGIVERVFFGRR